MEKLKLSRALVVEGRYDKAKLASLVEGTILQTDGFRVYRDKQLAAMIRAVAQKQGIVILTDSDRAGFQIRNYIRSLVKGADVVNVYIPQVAGKEKRKAAPGAEGLLGVEGIGADTLRELLRKAGALADGPYPDTRRKSESGEAGGKAHAGGDTPGAGYEDAGSHTVPVRGGAQRLAGERRISRMDFYEDGLMGGAGAAEKRRALLKKLGLPGYLSTAGLLEIINSLMTYPEYRAFCDGSA